MYFIASGVSGVTVALSFYILISLKGRKISEITKEGAKSEDEILEMAEKRAD